MAGHSQNENHAYIDQIIGGEENKEGDDGGLQGTGDGDDLEEADFDATTDAHQLMVESAGSGVSTEDGGGGGEGKAGATFLPTARPEGYSEAQLKR